ncbi:efflux RND transporter periplasmic adaptor subunit [Shewanella surugensis]|uniref:HlyD family efflux transporter periplasmic adaptor subunit n=1 Tax=Shewanella surugensis TaxID=212020 RepID=A0ABT0LBD7_9GAMM|nr:HlyD family efflux transporter periplasmic adaptor subunit [Shewanella surugensis]MCL1124662.1 HlyD family efflux transporter periplasmic adaptor subunit [Shewanella surugensis]
MRWITQKTVFSGLILTSAMLIIAGWLLGFSGNKDYIAANSINISQVQSGDFAQEVTGYGTLQSLYQRSITATTTAVVDSIHLKPGAVVEANTLIITLKNTQLEVALQQALGELKNSKTQKRKLILEQQREVLAQQSELSEYQANAEMASLQAEAEAPLAKLGVISAVEAKKGRLQAKQLQQKLVFELQKLDKLKQAHKEYLSIQDEVILQAQASFNNAKYQLDQLVVKAGIKGVLQSLPVSLGQSVNLGDKLAHVGSLSALIAEISVPQMLANLVQLNGLAEIDTRHGLVEGKIIRIAPVVENGAVRVDIQLPEDLSSDIRPLQMVDAVIFGQSRLQVSFIDTPQGVNENSVQSIFKLVSEDEGVLTEVKFGQISGKRIEVISGLIPGDKVVVAGIDPSDATQIQLTY